MIGKERIQAESFVVFSTDIGMKFGIKKYGISTLKRRKVVRCE